MTVLTNMPDTIAQRMPLTPRLVYLDRIKASTIDIPHIVVRLVIMVIAVSPALFRHKLKAITRPHMIYPGIWIRKKTLAMSMTPRSGVKMFTNSSAQNHMTMAKAVVKTVSRTTANQPVRLALSDFLAPRFCTASTPAAIPKPAHGIIMNWSILCATEWAATESVPKGMTKQTRISSEKLLSTFSNRCWNADFHSPPD
jgi:hypothetical protein